MLYNVTSFQINTNANLTDKYELFEIIGRGTYSTIYRAREIKTGKYWAAKIIKSPTDSDKINVTREIDIMKKLQHPKLLKIHEVFMNDSEIVINIKIVN